MTNDKRVANIEKYKAVLGEISKSNKLPGAAKGHQIDLGVAYDMLKEMAEKGDHTIYKGVPENFDWEGFKKDLQKE